MGAANTAVTAKNADIATLNGQIDTLVSQLADLNAQITTAEATVLDLNTRVAPLLAQLNQFNADVSATKGSAGHVARPADVAGLRSPSLRSASQS